MKKILSKIYLFIKNIVLFCFGFTEFIIKKNSLFSYTKKIGTVSILANGPSLNNVLSKIESIEFENDDFIVMNYMAFDKHFLKLKPKHYCFADPMFFQKTHRVDEVQTLFEILNEKVDWPMSIYIPFNRYKMFIEFSNLKNENIDIKLINTKIYIGFKKFRNFFYKNGLCCPPIHNVSNLAIYVAINYGFQMIKLYGVDHSFFDSLCVNDDNQLCNKEVHFYHKQTSLKPIINIGNGQVWKISDYMQLMANTFRSHDELAEYASYTSTVIINCTENSLIDSYNRLAKDKMQNI